MKIGFFVTDLESEKADYTTTTLALAAHRRGHQTYHISVDDFAFAPDDNVWFRGRAVTDHKYKKAETFLKAVRDPDNEPVRERIAELDILMIRNDPHSEALDRPWAQTVGVIFGQLAIRQGVIVLNDPNGLSKIHNKLYFQSFPQAVRPETLISRRPGELKEFVKNKKKAVLKPLRGSGGEGVFLVDSKKEDNLNQIIETLGKSGYIIAQEYLPEASKGDIRMFLMNGMPLEQDGKIAAVKRIGADDEFRNNITSGGSIEPAEIDDEMLRLADLLRPKLVQDGMFFAGIDIAGKKLMEINLYSPGGLIQACQMCDTDFHDTLLDAMEHKVEYAHHYEGKFDNLDLATL